MYDYVYFTAVVVIDTARSRLLVCYSFQINEEPVAVPSQHPAHGSHNTISKEYKYEFVLLSMEDNVDESRWPEQQQQQCGRLWPCWVSSGTGGWGGIEAYYLCWLIRQWGGVTVC